MLKFALQKQETIVFPMQIDTIMTIMNKGA